MQKQLTRLPFVILAIALAAAISDPRQCSPRLGRELGAGIGTDRHRRSAGEPRRTARHHEDARERAGVGHHAGAVEPDRRRRASKKASSPWAPR